MDKNEKTICGLLTAGLVMETVRAAVTVLMHCFPVQVLRMAKQVFPASELEKVTVQPLHLVRPLLHFGIMLVIFFVLRSECRKPTALSGYIPVLIPVVSIGLAVAGSVFSYMTVHLVSQQGGAAEVAAMSVINTISSAVTVLFSPALLMFAAAAGAIWYRRNQQQA